MKNFGECRVGKAYAYPPIYFYLVGNSILPTLRALLWWALEDSIAHSHLTAIPRFVFSDFIASNRKRSSLSSFALELGHGFAAQVLVSGQTLHY